MAIKDKEQAIIDLVINGQQASASLRDLTGTYNALFSATSKLKKENDPAYYEKQTALLKRVKAARDAEKESLLGQTKAQNGFFSDFSKGFSEIQEMAGRITAGTLIYKGVSAIIGGVKELFNGAEAAYEEAQRTQTQLQNVLKTTGNVAGVTKTQLEEYQQTLMDQTGVDDDVIAKGEEMLLTFTNIRGKIYEDALPAIVDMTAAMNGGQVSMEGIQKTSIQVGKALNDPITGMAALRKVGVTFSDQQKEQIKTMQRNNDMMGAQAMILKELQKEFGGTAKAIADTDVGKLQKFNTRIDNIKESLGKWMVAGKTLMADVLEPFLGLIEKATESKLSDTLRQEQTELNSLVGAIVSTNENQVIRNRLIDELQAKYPDFIGNISKEAATNDFLLQKLQQVNDLYRDRIFIAVNEEKIKGIQENRNKAIKDEADARERVAKASGKSATELAKLTDAQVKGLAMQQLAEQRALSALSTGQGTGAANSGSYWEDKAMHDVDLIINGRGRIANSFKEEADLMGANAIMQDKVTKQRLKDIDSEVAAINKRMVKESDEAKAKDEQRLKTLADERRSLLGIVEKPTSGPLAGEKNAAAAKAKKELDNYKHQLAETRDQIDTLIANATKGTTEGLDDQLQLIDNKYEKLINKLKDLNNNKFASAEDKKKNNGLIDELKINNTVEKLDTTWAADFKNDKALLDSQYAEQNAVLKEKYANDLITESEYNQQKYELEQKQLEDEYYLRLTYMEPTADLEAKMADNEIKNKKRAHDETMRYIKEQGASEMQLHKIQQDISDKKNALAMTGLQVLTDVFGKSKGLMIAQLALEKAIAIGRIIANEGIEIAGYWASNAILGPVGWGTAAVMTAAAKTRAGISIASIALESIGEVASIVSSDKKTAAKGGIFKGPGHGDGGLDVVDPRTGETVVNVEGDEPWMVLSRETRRNNGPLINQLLFNSMFRNGARVDVAGVTKGIQTAKNGGVVTNGAGQTPHGLPADRPGAVDDYEDRISRTEANIQALTILVMKEAAKKVILSNRLLEQEQAKNVQIKSVAKG